MAESQIQQQADRIITVIGISLSGLVHGAERSAIDCLKIGAFLGLRVFIVRIRTGTCDIEVVLAVIDQLHVRHDVAEGILKCEERHQNIVLIGDDRHVVICQ